MIHSEYCEPKKPERRDWIERSRPLVQQYIKNWRDGFPIPGRKRMKR